MDEGMVGPIGGSAIGVLGAALGTWAWIRTTKGPRERAFVAQVSVAAWLAALALVAMLWWLPAPYRFLVAIPWSVGLPLGIVRLNRIQRRLRAEESGVRIPSDG